MEQNKNELALTPFQQSFLRPLLLAVKIGEHAKETLGNFMRLVLRERGYPDDANAFLDMSRGERIVLVEDPPSNLIPFPLQTKPN